MLSKINRLTKKKDFEKVFREGEKFIVDCILLKKIKNNFCFSRFGFIVSTKVSKKAVLRNKVRRRLRNIVSKKLEKIQKGIDVVLVALSGSENKTFQELEQVLEEVFQKAKIINA